MFIETLSTLKINKLTQEQYDRELAAGNIDETALYLTPEEEIDLSGYATKNEVSSDYETKVDANVKLTEAQTYADNVATTAANKVKNDLLNNAGDAYDTLKELGDLIDDNKDAIDALNDIAAGKANAVHSHAISDVSGLQSALDGKAASSHGTHVSYSTIAPVMDGTASVGAASTVARSDHKHPTDTSRASKTEFDSHTSDTTKHITSTERTNWNAAKTHADSAHAPSDAQKNQNAFSNIKVGSTTISADNVTDTLELVGSNVTITPDATNDKVTIGVAAGTTSQLGIVKLENSTSSTSTETAATPSSVKSAYDLANTAKTNAANAQTRADNAYNLANSKVDSLSDLGITATATELNKLEGVTSNIQTQLNSKQKTVKLTQAQYDALPSSKNSDGILYAITDGESSSSGGGTSKPVELTKAQYEALGDSVNTDGILYAITDGDELSAKNLAFDGSVTGLGNNIQDAIDGLNSNMKWKYAGVATGVAGGVPVPIGWNDCYVKVTYNGNSANAYLINNPNGNTSTISFVTSTTEYWRMVVTCDASSFYVNNFLVNGQEWKQDGFEAHVFYR